MKLSLTIVCLIFVIKIASGQPLDSIGFSKVRLQSGKYEINRFGISKIKVKSKTPYPVADNISTNEKIIEGVFTVFTGWSTSSSSDALFQINNLVKFDGTNKNIEFPVRINGFYEKYRDRVNNEDGSHSMETVETFDLFWHEGAEGLIIENEKPLGEFVFKPGNMVGDSIEYWKSYLGQPPHWLTEKLDSYGNYDAPMDFIVYIIFDDQQYTLVYSGEYYQCALIHHQQMIGCWQDTQAAELVLSREKRIKPYLRLQSGLSDGEVQRTITLLTLGLSLVKNL